MSPFTDIVTAVHFGTAGDYSPLGDQSPKFFQLEVFEDLDGPHRGSLPSDDLLSPRPEAPGFELARRGFRAVVGPLAKALRLRQEGGALRLCF